MRLHPDQAVYGLPVPAAAYAAVIGHFAVEQAVALAKVDAANGAVIGIFMRWPPLFKLVLDVIGVGAGAFWYALIPRNQAFLNWVLLAAL